MPEGLRASRLKNKEESLAICSSWFKTVQRGAPPLKKLNERETEFYVNRRATADDCVLGWGDQPSVPLIA